MCKSELKKLSPRDLPDLALEMIANRFKALSEVSRLKLIIALEEGEKNVSRLMDETGLGQANVSRHLQTLLDAGILARRRDGVTVFYSIADPAIFKMCELVCGGLSKKMDAQANAFKPA